MEEQNKQETVNQMYTIQLIDKDNAYRSEVMHGVPDVLLEKLEIFTKNLEDLETQQFEITVLVIMEGRQFSRLPLYSLKTFIEFLSIKAEMQNN